MDSPPSLDSLGLGEKYRPQHPSRPHPSALGPGGSTLPSGRGGGAPLPSSRRLGDEEMQSYFDFFSSRLIVTLLIFTSVVGRSPETETLAMSWTICSGAHSPKIV